MQHGVQCVSCGGIWLDYGELGQIRDQYATEAERKEAARAYFHEAFGPEFDLWIHQGLSPQ